MTTKAPPFLPDGGPFRVAAVLFDFDGTLTEPGDLDFDAIRLAVGCPSGVGLLEYLESIDDAEERRRKEAILDEAESAAAAKSRPNSGAEELVAFLRAQRIPMAVITRNSGASVERSLSCLQGIERNDFALIVSRDLALGPKPLPDGVLHVAVELGVDPAHMLLIGDHAYDIEAGRRAGALTMFLQNHPAGVSPGGQATRSSDLRPGHRRGADADFVVDDLFEAARVIRYGLPLPTGKLPADLLEESLGGLVSDDPSVLVSARLGEDAAAVDVSDADILVLASDPITLASEAVASYAVLANANDIATSGALPRWFLTTLLFPPGSTGSEVAALVRDIERACRRWGITLSGGHTEITDAVCRPLVVGTMAGTVADGRLLDKRGMREGDTLFLTKGVAVEGTGLIAREFGERLRAAGMSGAEIEICAAFLARMSILDEARIALSFDGVRALHDVTEGGLATAVSELGAAGGRRLRIEMEAIPVYPETRRLCKLLGLDPLGLIGSGSLLITCASDQAAEMVATLSSAGIEVAAIGEVLGEGRGVEALRGDEQVDWPRFDRDEVSRLTR